MDAVRAKVDRASVDQGHPPVHVVALGFDGADGGMAGAGIDQFDIPHGLAQPE